MSGASEHVLAMARAHYGRDERAFANAAMTLARQSKSPGTRASIESIVKRGIDGLSRAPDSGRPVQQARPAQPEPESGSTEGALYLLPEFSFDGLLLAEHLRGQLNDIVAELKHAEALRERGLRASNRLLFHGPPGNGKTSHASALAHALGRRAYCVSIPELTDKYVGQSAKNVASVFGALRDGMVMVFDELDAIGAARAGGIDPGSRERDNVLNTLLQLFDRHKVGVIIGTTNRPDILDPALRRRFDEQLLFPPPSRPQLRSLAAKLCTSFGIDASTVDVDACPNFDACTKHVHAAAKRQVMAELGSAKGGKTRGKEDN